MATPVPFRSPWPAPAEGRPEVRYDLDAYHRLYDEACEATQMAERAMRRQRHYLIPQVIRRTRHVPGDAAEIGCFRGLSSYVACATYEEIGREVAFHIFDSFEGLSEPGPDDASAHLRPQRPTEPNRFLCPEDVVRANLARFPFIEYHAGWVPTRFDDVADGRFSYVHIDVDLRQPTADSIAYFWPRLSVGGAMVLDDHATLMYPGARLAAEGYFRDRSDAFLVETPSGSAVVVKLAG